MILANQRVHQYVKELMRPRQRAGLFLSTNSL